MNDIRAIFFDVDGTLVSFATRRISPGTAKALWKLRERGIELYLCTGRSPSMLPELYEVFPFDGWAAFNGQLCVCGDRVLRKVPLERTVTEELVGALEILDIPCIFLEQQETYVNRADPVTTDFMLGLRLPVPPPLGLRRALEGELYQCLAFLPESEEPRLRRLAPHVSTTRWHPDFVDVIPTGGGKNVGMGVILKDLGLKKEQVMAFGDGGNDVPMLRMAGLSVAMGNAGPSVKEQADYITGSVDEDGVVSALEHFGLI